MRRIRGRHEEDPVQLALVDRLFCDSQMCVMDGVKSTAEKSQFQVFSMVTDRIWMSFAGLSCELGTFEIFSTTS